MREIKFKYVVKSSEEAYVSRPFSLKEIEKTNNMLSDISDDFPKDKFQELYLHGRVVTKLQYTGLKDKNGVEIYEGDIAQSPHSKFKIVFTDGMFTPSTLDGYATLHTLSDINKYFEVIGNIYENKELIE